MDAVKEQVKSIVVGLEPSAEAKFDTLYALESAALIEYCGMSEITGKHVALLADLLLHRYNTLGRDGISAESYSGVSYTYSTDLPATLHRRLNRARRLSW